MSWKEVYAMGGNCCGTSCDFYGRGFMTRAEKVEMLQEYKKNLENEAQGVAERIKELSEDD